MLFGKAYGLFIFCFAGHPCFPALHENMRQAKQWTGCVALSFCIAALYYAPRRAHGSHFEVVSGAAGPLGLLGAGR